MHAQLILFIALAIGWLAILSSYDETQAIHRLFRQQYYRFSTIIAPFLTPLYAYFSRNIQSYNLSLKQWIAGAVGYVALVRGVNHLYLMTLYVNNIYLNIACTLLRIAIAVWWFTLVRAKPYGNYGEAVSFASLYSVAPELLPFLAIGWVMLAVSRTESFHSYCAAVIDRCRSIMFFAAAEAMQLFSPPLGRRITVLAVFLWCLPFIPDLLVWAALLPWWPFRMAYELDLTTARTFWASKYTAVADDLASSRDRVKQRAEAFSEVSVITCVLCLRNPLALVGLIRSTFTVNRALKLLAVLFMLLVAFAAFRLVVLPVINRCALPDTATALLIHLLGTVNTDAVLLCATFTGALCAAGCWSIRELRSRVPRSLRKVSALGSALPILPPVAQAARRANRVRSILGLSNAVLVGLSAVAHNSHRSWVVLPLVAGSVSLVTFMALYLDQIASIFTTSVSTARVLDCFFVAWLFSAVVALAQVLALPVLCCIVLGITSFCALYYGLVDLSQLSWESCTTFLPFLIYPVPVVALLVYLWEFSADARWTGGVLGFIRYILTMPSRKLLSDMTCLIIWLACMLQIRGLVAVWMGIMHNRQAQTRYRP
ncbi:unnamed protein product [Discula destructiva]